MKKRGIIKNYLFSVKTIWHLSKSLVIQSCLLIVLQILLNFLTPLIAPTAVSSIEQNKGFAYFLISSGTVIAMATACRIIYYAVVRYGVNPLREKIRPLVRLEAVFIPSLSADYELFERADNQEQFEKARDGADNLFHLFSDGIMFFAHVGTVIVASAVLISVNSWLLIIVIICSLLQFVIERRNIKYQENYWREIIPFRRKVTYCNNISRNTALAKDLRIFGMNKFIDSEREKNTGIYRDKYRYMNTKRTFNEIIMRFLMLIAEISLYGFMVWEVLKNRITIATFTFMIAAVMKLINSFGEMLSVAFGMYLESIEIEEYHKFTNRNLIKDYEIKTFDEKFSSVEFRNVCFAYFRQDGYALKDVSFKLNKGEKLALVGLNGAGKTTLIKLLCGLYHPSSGEILLNGVNIERMDRKVLARYIAPVFQDIVNYNLEIGENVAFSINPDREAIEKALRDSDLADRVKELPKGLKTIIGRELDEDGIELSGGESQKLALARCLYKNAPIMVLDEPTGAIDALSEGALYRRLNDITKGNATIFISHRLSSTKFCDRIIMLEKGEIIERGTHEQLMSANGKYSDLFNMQAKYYQEGVPNEGA